MDEKHLCDNCLYHIATCAAKRIVFGIDRYPHAKGADADRVLECDTHNPTTRSKTGTHIKG